jgi:tetratricopeptide (TPR) repeat protein
VTGTHSPDRPTSDEIEAGLSRILHSDPFRTSPQLASFLRFVVTATLSGRSDIIKGYTIAIEALGRSEDFDPQSDPIVRVEAARLRRALERYYAQSGAAEPVVIELPRGSYVPVFWRRPPEAQRVRAADATWLAAIRHRVAALRLRQVVTFLGVAGMVAYVLLDLTIFNAGSPSTTRTTTNSRNGTQIASTALAEARSGLPVVAVHPLDWSGSPDGRQSLLGDFTRKLRDAFARFDEVEVASDPPARAARPPAVSAPQSDYRVTSTVESEPDGRFSLTVRLHDVTAGTVAWTRTFADLRLADDPAAAQEDIVRQVTATIAAPYGVIFARELAKQAGNGGDQRYRCLLDAFDYRRRNDPTPSIRVRACLERATGRDPTFTGGFAELAMLWLREHYDGDGRDAELLDRALNAAKRAVELAPESARAHQALMGALFARGEVAGALAEGEKAASLNPYDPTVLIAYALRLLGADEIQQGTSILERTSSLTPVNPPILEFGLIASAYLRGDDATARYRANLLVGDTYPPALILRALVAARVGERERARDLIDKVAALDPSWNDDLRGRLARFIPSPKIVDRIAADLAAAGLGAARTDMGKAGSTAADGGRPLVRPADMPLVSVSPFETIGVAAGAPSPFQGLWRTLRDALARFDEIDVAEPPSRNARLLRPAASSAGPRRSEYHLGGTIQQRPDGTIGVAFRLYDADGTLVWTHSFENLRVADGTQTRESDIVQQVATLLAQPYGVIYARERSKVGGLDPRYRCLLDAFEFWRGFDRSKSAAARECLKRVTALDPTFADGFALLSLLTLRDHYEPGSGGADPTDTALVAARRAVDLRPQSARARQALMSTLYARGQIDSALAEGEKMIALNPYDMMVVLALGTRLVLSGQVERGAALVRRAAVNGPVRPAMLEFSLFLCDYLLGEDANPTSRARLYAHDNHPLVLVARAIVAARAGDRDRAQDAIDRLITLHPGWQDNPRQRIERYVPNAAIAQRLARDLSVAGLGAVN